jgi:Tfp pilus assembly protein PilF
MNLPEVFLGGFLLGPEQLARVADPDRRFRDDLPVLDYATAHAHHLQTNEIAIARLLRDHAAPIDPAFPSGISQDLRNRVRAIQAGNIGDIAASARVRQAIGFTERGEASRAIDALRQALNWNADHVDANRRLGDLYFRQRQPDRALPYFAAAARIHPGDVAAQHGTAVSLHRTGRVSESIPHYERAVALDTGNAELRNNLGAALAEVGRYEEALVHLEEAVRLRPGYADAERNLGKLRQVLGTRESRSLRLN